MKTKSFIIVALLALMFFSGNNAIAQVDTTKITSSKIYIITTYDGGEFIGKIILQDAKEVLIETKDRGQVSIPKYQIKEMKEVKSGEFSASGEYMPEQIFATRYFITTNGLPISKGESYLLLNLYGPEFQFGVGENFGVGIMTSWLGMPLIGTAKYSIELSEKTNLGIGTLLGTGSWAKPDFGLALPFAVLTFGDRRNNINFSGGYGAIWSNGDSEGNALFSIAGMAKVGKNISLVFDSFIMPNLGGNNTGFALLIPGIRIQEKSNKAFQFGFAGLVVDGDLMPFPIPMIQWYKKF
ncbi:hypothetical protein ES708_27342 [subsurface metagenome]